MGKRAGPGDHGTNAVPNCECGLRPINLAILLFDFRRIDDAFGRLWARRNFSGNEIRYGADEKPRADFREAIVQGLRIVARVNRRFSRRGNLAGVEAGVHFHDGDARFGIAVKNGVLNGGGAAILWQQGGMDVQAAESRQIQNGLWQNLAVSSDSNQAGFERAIVR